MSWHYSLITYPITEKVCIFLEKEWNFSQFYSLLKECFEWQNYQQQDCDLLIRQIWTCSIDSYLLITLKDKLDGNNSRIDDDWKK